MSDVVEAVEDPERLAALRKADLLDTPPEEAFDQIARLASRLLNAPTALVSLVDKDRQFSKSCIGPLPDPARSEGQTPLSHSFCQYAVAAKEALLVEDAREHPVLKDNLATRDLGVVAYAGIPLITPEGHALGTLCVIDSKPRQWSTDQIETLRSLASSVMSTISYRAEARAGRGEAEAGVAPANGTVQLSEAEEVLARAVSTFLRSLDAYDQCLRGSGDQGRELECQTGVLDAEKHLKSAAQTFQERLEALGGRTDDPRLQRAVELLRSCQVYFDADQRRTDVTKRFQELQAALAEVEREVMLVSRAEHAIRMASRTYALG